MNMLGKQRKIYVNGRLADTLIKRPYQADITGLLQVGENKIEIVAVNLLINRMIDPGYPEKELEKMIPPVAICDRRAGSVQKRKAF